MESASNERAANTREGEREEETRYDDLKKRIEAAERSCVVWKDDGDLVRGA